MGYRRFIDPGLWTSRELNQAPIEARHLFIYLFSTCDDYGRMKDDIYRFRHGAFADDAFTDEDVRELVDELEGKGLIRRYQAQDGTPLVWVCKFHAYQPMRHRRRSVFDHHPEDTMADGSACGETGKAPEVSAKCGETDGLPEISANCVNPGKLRDNSACIGVVTPIDTADAVPAACKAAAGTDVGGKVENDLIASAETSAVGMPGSARTPGGHDDGKRREDTEGVSACIGVDRRLNAVALDSLDYETATWKDNGCGIRQKARERIELGYDAAQVVLAHVWALNRSKTKRPWRLLGNRMRLAREPSDAAMEAAGKMLREAEEAT